jgi:hypothetical protein
MLPSDIELRLVEQRYRDLRLDAAAYRMAQAARKTESRRGGLRDRLRAIGGRLGLSAPAHGPAGARA